MARALYIGGYGNGRSLAGDVGYALAAGGYEHIDSMTASEAMTDPDRVRKLTRGIDVFTHSMGMIAIQKASSSPKELTAFNAPLPTPLHRLVSRTIAKSVQMGMPDGIHDFSEQSAAVIAYNRSSVAELAAHPFFHLRTLLGRTVTHFNAFEVARSAVESGIPTRLIYTDRDLFFPSDQQYAQAEKFQFGFTQIPGVHDQLPLYPDETLGQI